MGVCLFLHRGGASPGPSDEKQIRCCPQLDKSTGGDSNIIGEMLRDTADGQVPRFYSFPHAVADESWTAVTAEDAAES